MRGTIRPQVELSRRFRPLQYEGGDSLDFLIKLLALAGICLGAVSFIRPRPVFRYGFYGAVLAATGLRMMRSVTRGEPLGFLDVLLFVFLLTAMFWEFVSARRNVKS